MRVLIAEDNLTQRLLVRSILVRTRYEILEAVDGQEAWDIMQHTMVQIVITDWLMPRMDGPELIRRIRLTDFGRYIYVLLLTAKNEREDVVTGLHTGADDYLIKPVDADELLARVGVGERVLALETSLRTARDQFHIQAMHDHLTGLLNRQALYERVNAELSRRQRKVHSISVLLLDVDHFKRINDLYGHAVGDQALLLVARILDREKRLYDMAARWGGEEFALVLPETSLNDAMVVAERIRSSMYAASLIVPQGKTLSFQVSIGVSSAAADEQVGLDELLNQADAALYHAKRTGRNRVCSASDVPPEDLPTAVSPDNIYEKSLPGSSHLLARIGRLHDELHIIAQELGTLLETLLTPEQRAMVETVRQRSLALIDLLGDVSIESGETPQ